MTTAPHHHQFAVTPPRGSINQPGDCPCGTTYQQARNSAGGKGNPMPDTPLTDQQLDEIEAMPRAEDIDTLVAEVRRLRAGADRVRALGLLEAADFLRDAHFRDGLSVQAIVTALRHTIDGTDPAVGSLDRDGFSADEIADILAVSPVSSADTGSET